MPSGALLRATFLVGQFAAVWADGWYYSFTAEESCTDVCTARGGTCDEIKVGQKHNTIDGGSIFTLAADTGARIEPGATALGWDPSTVVESHFPYYDSWGNTLHWDDMNTADCIEMAQGGQHRFCYCSGITPTGAGVGGDPITHFHGVEYKFSILNHELTELLRTEDLVVRASCFPGDQAEEQWIGWIVVESTDGEPLADIKIRNMTEMDASDGLPRSSLETLKLSLPWLQKSLVSFEVDEADLVEFSNFKVRPFHHPHKGVGIDLMKISDYHEVQPSLPRREGLLITGASLSMFISSSSAREYYWTDIDDHRAWKYAHLDIEFLDTKNTSSWTGLLPEIWGIKPRSDASNQALVKAQASTSAQALIKAQATTSAQAAPPTQASTSEQASTSAQASDGAAAEADSDRHQLNRQIFLAMLSSEEWQDLSDSGVCGSDGCSHDSREVTV